MEDLRNNVGASLADALLLSPTPRATARAPPPHNTQPALTKIRCSSLTPRSLCKGGSGEDEGMGPLRSPSGWGGVVIPNEL